MRGRSCRLTSALVCGLLLALPAGAQTPLGTDFTYQGRLTDAGAPGDGSYDLEFKLFGAASGGSQVGSTVALGSVGVTNGLFTVSLDFGTGVFAGSRRWLQMGVRPGGTGGAYTTLLPRQELNAGPNAIYALAAASARTVAGLTCSSGQVVKWSGTSWTCGADVDTNGGGTVTGVGTGAGLTGGPITTSGTVAVATGGISSSLVADGAITSAKVAAGAVGLSQIDPSQVQTRFAAMCPGGQFLRGVNADGSVVCEAFYLGNEITTVDNSASVVGFYTSIAIGTDGFPVISYWDYTAYALKVAKCVNAACTGTSTITTVDDPANSVGFYTSIANGTDGFPVISYQDDTAGALKVAKCVNAACTGTSTITTVDDPANTVGWYTSIAIGTDGFPVISYMDTTAYALKVAKCVNAACTGTSTITTVYDPANSVGGYTSIAIGTEGFPVISYRDGTAGALKVAKCVNAACTGTSTITAVDDPANSVGYYTSIAIGTDGFPVISYGDGTAYALKVAKCVNAACTGTSTITTVDDPANFVGTYNSIAIGTDGFPVISYSDYTAYALKVAKCVNAACTGTSAITTVDDPANSVGSHTSLAIGTDGFPVISYRDGTAGALKVAKCRKASCAP